MGAGAVGSRTWQPSLKALLAGPQPVPLQACSRGAHVGTDAFESHFRECRSVSAPLCIADSLRPTMCQSQDRQGNRETPNPGHGEEGKLAGPGEFWCIFQIKKT